MNQALRTIALLLLLLPGCGRERQANTAGAGRSDHAVLDFNDRCDPSYECLQAFSDERGCPNLVVSFLPNSVVFDDKASTHLARVADALAKNEQLLTLEIIGYASSKDPQNPLAHQRAEAVKRALIDLGVRPARLVAIDGRTTGEDPAYVAFFVADCGSPPSLSKPADAGPSTGDVDLAHIPNTVKRVHVCSDCGVRPILESVYFGHQSSRLGPVVEPLLNALLAALKQEPEARLACVGRASRDEKRREPLSLARARAVCGWLVNHGIASNRLEHHAWGAGNPVNCQRTRADRKANRRVSLKVLYVDGKPIALDDSQHLGPGHCASLRRQQKK